ncbi:S-adenosyl-L-methionine-dependent methyltransferase [Coniella lustricola]|uniref:catechol O-methyltransferase n=1 Tax=Coniella lustricola TaxID=2025994 RepID=A0A2T3A565_9PEZI|nr:S-adenosyl-L-methionine-dependent methyltransferase [Coniella lustricola]
MPGHTDDVSLVTRSAEVQQQLREHIVSQPADKFAGKPWQLVQEIEQFANEKRLPMIFRSAKISTSKTFLETVEPKPKTVVEFGTFVGTSAVAWAAILQEFHGADAKDIKVYTFEFDEKVAAVAKDIIKAAGLDHIVEVFVGPGSESLKKLVAEGRLQPGQVDVVFIDHWEKFYLPDLKLVEELKLFHVGSVALADNTDMPGAPDYLAHVQKGGEGPVKYESRSLKSQSSHGPSIVEASRITAV